MSHTTAPTSSPIMFFHDKWECSVSGLEALLNSPLLVFKYRCFTQSYAAQYWKQHLHIKSVEVHRVTKYKLVEPVALAIWSSARNLCAYILESANNYTIRDALTKPPPRFIPLRALQTLDIANPVIAHIPFLYDSNPLLEAQDSIEEIWMRVDLVQLVLLTTIQWLTKAIHQCVDEGLQAEWYWGAQFGMSNVDFYNEMGVEKAEQKLLESKVTNIAYFPIGENTQLILHPTQSRMARVFSAGTMVKYEGGKLPLPDLDNDEPIDGSMIADLQLDG